MATGAKMYEYAVETVQDNRVGSTNTQALAARINNRACDGWRLVTSFTNELGVNSQSFMGVGTNATIDETVLIFEREILNVTEHVREHALPIINSNMVDPIIPKQVLLKERPDGLSVSLMVANTSNFPLAHLKCDLVVRNVFGDEARLENLCFLSFSRDTGFSFVSEDRPIELPAHIRSCPTHADMLIRCYIAEGQLVQPESDDVVCIAEARAGLLDGFSPDSFLSNVKDLTNAKEIYQHALKQIEDYPGIFAPELLEKMQRIVRNERFYGCGKDDMLRTLTKFFNTGEV